MTKLLHTIGKKLTDKNIILGGGLSGLGAACHSDFPVYEACTAPGGTAGSVTKNGYVFDFGIHVLHSKDTWFQNFMSELKIDFVKHFRKAMIFSYGAYAKYPFQVNTAHLPISIRFKCVLGYLASICQPNRKSPENYEEWIRYNFGKGFAEQFLIPYSTKFWGVPPNDMTHEWTGQQRVPQPRLMDVLKGAFRDQEGAFGPNDQFRYPAKPGAGFAGIALAMAAACDRVHCAMKATALIPDKKLIFFNHEDAPLAYDRLITTIPLPELIKLIPDPPHEVQDAVKLLRFNSIAIVNLGIDRKAISRNHWIHFPDQDISFFRISFPSNFCRELNPEGTSTIQAEVSYHYQNPPDESLLLARVKKDLIGANILTSQDKILFHDVLFRKYGYVVYDINRAAAVKVIHDYLKARDIFPCGRYGCWEYLWADQAVQSGKKTAQEVSRL